MSEYISNAIIQAVINYILSNITQTPIDKALPYMYPVFAIGVGIIYAYFIFSPRCAYSKMSFCRKSCSSYQEYNLPVEKKQVMRLGIDKEIVENKRGKIAWCARGTFEIKNKRKLEDFSVKGTIKEIREKANTVSRLTKEPKSPFEEYFVTTRHIWITLALKKWCENLPQDERDYACELVDAINKEKKTADKLNALNYALMYFLTLSEERMKFGKIRKFLANNLVYIASGIAGAVIAALYATLGLTISESSLYVTTVLSTVLFLLIVMISIFAYRKIRR